MNMTRATVPAGATMLTASCVVCGEEFRALTDRECRVDHRCATPVIGAVWVLCDLQPVRVRGAA